MPRQVSCWIDDRADGRFDAVAVLEPERVFRRDGFATLAEAEEWIEGLRILMAALGAPVIRTDDGEPVAMHCADDREQFSEKRI